ncbi:p24 complex component [Spiromyces aspiralis]|uniref:P24 complex component n=1 Tax=Spiromyces aspiralis TaxID=68401 RepID=A0ACC1HLG4_9FUNG|nr:p24 complex component [Spiromyces aspiralis]
MNKVAWHVLVALIAALLPAVTFGYTTILRSENQECYSELMKRDEHFSITYDVANKYPVDFMIMDPSNRVLYANSGTPNGEFGYKATMDGKFTYCFKAPKGNDLVVNFNPHSPEDEEFLKADDDKASPLEKEIRKLSHNVEDVIDHFQNMIARDNVRYESGTMTHSRIYTWSIVQSVALVGVGCWQIYYLTSIFKSRAIV